MEIVDLTNLSPVSCRVGGYPALVGVTSSGKRVPLDARHGTYFVDPLPGVIAPGSIAELNLGTYEPACQGKSTPGYTSVIIELPEGMGDVVIGAFDMPDVSPAGTFMPCDLSESQIGVSRGTSATTPTSSEAASCSSQQLSWSAWSNHPGDTEDLGALVVVTNTSTQPCSLSGRPVATAILSTGRAVPTANDPAGSSLLPDAGQPTTVRPGGLAYLRFRDPAECASGASQGPPDYTAIQIRFSGKVVTIALNNLTVPAGCGLPLYESPFY